MDADMSPDLSDLRFTDLSGAEVLPHWLETSTPPLTFRAWVRVPHVPEQDVGAIYMWYGNADAEDASDAAATFHFWDGFDGDALADTWISNGEYELANGRLMITNGAVYSFAPLTEAPGWVAEARMRWPNDDDDENPSGVFVGSDAGVVNGVDYVRLYRGGNGLSADVAVNGNSAFGQINIMAQSPQDQLDWMRVGTGPDLARMGWGHAPPPATANLDPSAELETDLYVWLGEAGGIGVVSPGDIFDVEIDAVLVRRFEQFRPETSQGPEDDV